ncbi:MAG: hypothetical protein IPJ62_10910 [Betaproteobacteria bacterium]|nr:hypothetical protein [Betaproteobacteria bacterium]
MNLQPLDNIVWRCLTGAHAGFARGSAGARRLVARPLRLQVGRGQLPFLHAVDANVQAGRLYARMGFVHPRDLVVRVVTRVPSPTSAKP